VAPPTELKRRLVEGLFGKGYLFSGKGSTLVFRSGVQEPRGCAEMYGPKANLFGDAGTVSFWIKPLPNSHNMAHVFFRAWPLQVIRNQYTHHQYHYAAKGGYIYDGTFAHNAWVHFAMTWRKDEARSYYNGSRMSTLTGTGVVKPTPDRFEVAGQAMRWLNFQKKEYEDDTVIDEFQIFRRPLTDEEVRSLFERGHVTTRHQVGNTPDVITKPERAYGGHALVAPEVRRPIRPDGELSDWKGIPSHGGLIERRVGVLDDDPGQVYVACDREHLYFGFSCPVDASIQSDPTHVWYPTGEFLAGVQKRDGDVSADDYVEFAIKGKDGHVYRFALNAKNVLRDSRDGDVGWNTKGTFASRSDFKDWTAELAVPLAELGLALGDTVEFNVVRSWKLFKSSQNALCADERSQPAWGKLTLGGPAAAAVESLGLPWQGRLAVTGTVSGPPGEYTVRLRGRGLGQTLAAETKVRSTGALTRFALDRRLEKPGDLAVVVEVLVPAGKPILVRTVPFVYAAPTTVELANYPGWGRLEVAVSPVAVDFKDLHASVAVMQGDKAVRTADIPRFDDPAQTVAFDTKPLAPGAYQVVTRLYRGQEQVGEDRQPYEKKTLPEWYHNQVGVIDRPPIPWTPVQVRGTTITCLLKEMVFSDTLFPAQIVSNGQLLLAGPIRLRIKRDGQEKILTSGELKMTGTTPRRASWQATARDGSLTITIHGSTEFDGFTWVDATFTGGKVEHLSLEIPLKKESATLKSLEGPGLMGDKPLKATYPGYWFGNEKAGFQYWWEDQRGWVLNNEPVTVTPGPRDVVIAIPVIQKAVDLAKPRTVSFGWTITPSKPLRKDRRTLQLYRGGVSYTAGDYTFATPNYPKPRLSATEYARMAEELKRKDGPIACWYAFGPFMWVGAPEYAEWWREWRYTPSEITRPDANSTAWGPVCHNSSGSDLHIWMLDRFLKKYPQRAVYFDCMSWCNCDNEAHGCGYVDEHGVRQPQSNLLATRRHHERIYNLIKAADPEEGWVRFHDWAPNMAVAPFCDDNWIGEGFIGPIGGTPEKNYYRVLDLPAARYYFANEQWGHLTSFLTELATTAGEDKERRAACYGKMVRPPRDGWHGEWTLPRWKDYEHVAGLGMAHDMWQVGGNDLQLPWMWLMEVCRQMHWDDRVRFVGYWEASDLVRVGGGVPEKIVCSVYYRPAGLGRPVVPRWNPTKVTHGTFTVPDAARTFLRAQGERDGGWLILVPVNNTDQDVTLTLKPDLKKLGLASSAKGRLLDVYRAFDFTWQAPPGWFANAGDPEGPYITIKGREEGFPLDNGAATVAVPKRNFRMLLFQSAP
jgi:hypothetical protein